MQAGDFTTLADCYAKHRPDYSHDVLTALLGYVQPQSVADVGAGTGIWTRMLASSGLTVQAVEPNDEMRQQGMNGTGALPITWSKGTAEHTGLFDGCVDWLTMASSFHWANLPEALAEFHRVLKPGGYLTVLWNPRNIEGNTLHERIEALVNDKIAGLERVSSGSARHTRQWNAELTSTSHFQDVIFFEAHHEIAMSHERYIGAWRSVNDIQRQAGPVLFEELLHDIEQVIKPLPVVVVPYKTRCWTARRSP